MPLAPGLARPKFSCLHIGFRSSAGSYQCSRRCFYSISTLAASATAVVIEESTEHASQQPPSNITSVATAKSHQQQPAWGRHRRRQHYKQQSTRVQDASSNNKLSAAPPAPQQQQHGPRATLLYIPRGFETQATTAASTHGLLLQDCSSAAGSAMAVPSGPAPAQQQQVAQHPPPPQQQQQQQQLPPIRDVNTQHMGRTQTSNRLMQRKRRQPQHSHKHMMNEIASAQQQQEQWDKVANHSPKVKQQRQRRQQRVQRETPPALPMADEHKIRHVAAATVAPPAAALETAAVATARKQTAAPVQATSEMASQTAAAAEPAAALAPAAAASIPPTTAAAGGDTSEEAAATALAPNSAAAAAAAAGAQIPTAALTTSPPAPEAAAAAAAAAAADVANPSTPAAAAAPSKWQLAVNKRLSTVVNTPSIASVRQARLNRLQHRANRSQPSVNSSSSRRDSWDSSSSGTNGSSMSLKPRAFSTSNAASQTTAAAAAAVGEGGVLQQYREAVDSGRGLSAAAEADLCEMYQAHIRLQDQLRSAHEQPAAAAAAMLVDAAKIQQRGLTAQQLLLQLYEPLITNRSRRAAALNHSVDPRELRDAAARAVVTAAAKFDRQKAGGNMRLASLAAVYIKTAVRDVLREYQSVPVVLPAEVLELRRKLSKLQQQLTLEAAGLQPTTSQLAAAAGLPVSKVEQVLQATSMQASGLVQGGDDTDDAGAGGDVDLLQLDVSQSADDLDYIAGAVKHARQGLKEEQQAAEESKSLALIMQQSILSLKPKDRTLLALRLGLVDPSTVAAAAAAATFNTERPSTHDANSRSGRSVKRREKIFDRIPVIPIDTLLQKLESVNSLEDYDTQAGLSVAELSRLFNMPRQRGHQLVQGVVLQLRERLRNAARSDAELALLLAATRGKVQETAHQGR